MATLLLSLLLFIFLLLPHTTTSFQNCERTSCQRDGLSIQFPFNLREAKQSNRCGYPGFELSCNSRSQTLLTLPNAGEFVVTDISIKDQKVWINDPNGCLPKRLLHNLDLNRSPFGLSDTYDLVSLTFFNCPFSVIELFLLQSTPCISPGNDNYSVVAVLPDSHFPVKSLCRPISSALVPSANRPLLYDNIELQWIIPHCGICESGGEQCGFLTDTGPEIACYKFPGQDSEGLSRSGKYWITLGLGIPGVICIIVAVLLRGKLNRDSQRSQASMESDLPQPAVVVTGLDESTIEQYPKAQLGESGRLPNPNDNLCSICLCEYQPRETLRTIPECNHYFHAYCIDEWLKMNATCPLCRNLPENPSLATSSLSLS